MKALNIIIETERLLLRKWEVSDALTLYKLASDPDVGPRAGWPPHKSVDESEMIIKNMFNNATTWAMVLKDTNDVIGAIGYGPSCNCNLMARENEPVVGYWLGKDYWNRGLCTEALKALIDNIKQTTTISSLISGHFIDNPASGKVMEKCGFVATGDECFDESLYAGENRPIRVLRIELK